MINMIWMLRKFYCTEVRRKKAASACTDLVEVTCRSAELVTGGINIIQIILPCHGVAPLAGVDGLSGLKKSVHNNNQRRAKKYEQSDYH